MPTYIVKKCRHCHGNIAVNTDEREWVPEPQNSWRFGYYHKDCFKKKYFGIYEDIDNKIEEYREKFQYYQENKTRLREEVGRNKQQSIKATYNIEAKNELCDYITKEYNLTFMTKSFFVFLDSILSGKSKKTSRPIPPEDLLDMWQKKRKYLLKTADRNRRIGKEITGEQLVRYDMAILLSRYDSYLAWKEQQKMIADNDTPEYVIPMANTTHMKKCETTDDEVDIMSMLDEI